MTLAPGLRRAVGWLAVSLSIALSCFWAFWGIIENFHEGWYYEFWLSNVGLMVVQYLSPALLCVGITVVAIVRRRVGALLHLVPAVLVVWFFDVSTNAVVLVLALPLAGLGLLYWVGAVARRRMALTLATGLPLLSLIVFGAEPAIRVSQRLDDGDRGAREVFGNGVSLVWAPEGPGWPTEGTEWSAARRACRHLDGDGLVLSATPQDLWRLPTVEVVVRSMARHGQNSGGVWDAATQKATYETKPDKESPLWDVHSQVIYWWTASEVDRDRAYIVAYDGQVWPRSKSFGPGYLGFRCVRDP